MVAKISQATNFSSWTEDPPSMTLRYVSSGEFDETLVRIAARSTIPSAMMTEYGVLYRQNLAIVESGYKQYTIDAPFGVVKRETGTWTFDFDTTGATVHITTSKQHIQSYPTAGNIHKGSIGVKPDGSVEGAEIIIPALKFTIKYRHPHGVVTMPFVKTLARATGRTNVNPYLTYAVGELLFLGATGSDGTESDAEVGYTFAASENDSDLSFGDITGIVKKGHELAWVEHREKTEGGKPATQPKLVHIERVYDAIDMATVLGFS